MIKIDIVKRVASELNLKDREALAIVDTIIDSIKEAITEHGRMEIRNFGVFQVKQRKPRTGRNPRNKKEYPILPRKVVTFKLGKELKNVAVQDDGQAGGEPVGAAPKPAGASKPAAASPHAAPTGFEQTSFLPEDQE
ncbi:MAG TPA: HU family DNA-binding protein [Candidatus Sumerlaeota bacterium]|nr:HU family DNA-binding protein [Candidatus Sumerlaeota bacterium]HOR29019.1 HU family DNA-binding protein [Candidatus Sumerlaeota bacterium]HPK03253.1 HU family DNA-binding protein [Candidatus Sumerlaeota bacterium]